jgi:deoxyribodipyrimidine photo-lyase
MTQLNTTGWMHNRQRMIVASFSTKHLLGDYRNGERYFEQRLVHADLAANNGGWQWSSSTGTDAVPYFRVFSPTRKDDVRSRRCVRARDYPAPIVDHAVAAPSSPTNVRSRARGGDELTSSSTGAPLAR